MPLKDKVVNGNHTIYTFDDGGVVESIACQLSDTRFTQGTIKPGTTGLFSFGRAETTERIRVDWGGLISGGKLYGVGDQLVFKKGDLIEFECWGTTAYFCLYI